IFAAIFVRQEHLDILFLNEAQEPSLKSVCAPFYAVSTLALNTYGSRVSTPFVTYPAISFDKQRLAQWCQTRRARVFTQSCLGCPRAAQPMSGLVPAIQSTACFGASVALDPGNTGLRRCRQVPR